MGCQHSKLKKRYQRRVKEEEEEQNINLEDVSDAALIRTHDQETINTIKKDLNDTPEMFVLNNVLMCTIFLRNYQEDIRAIQYRKIVEARFWEPDIVMEKANNNIIYRPMHGPKKDVAEPLVKKRIYVPLNEYVEVCSPLDDGDEIENNSSSKYRVKIEESKRHGYVKLQRLNTPNNHDGNSLKDMLVLPSSTNSGSSDTESTGTSIGMAIKENPQLIKDQYDEGTLDDCFVYRKVKKTDIDLELEDMDHENLRDEDIYDIVSYLPSRKFMKFFQSKVFRENIAEKLGLIKYEIDYAIVDEHIPGKIFCNIRDDNGNYYPVEVLPCLKCSWPSKQTYEFFEGKTYQDEDNNNCFQWPTDEMLEAVKFLECALVPRGYSKTKGLYPEGDLEWEFHFPLAESCLESLLRPQQIKCYLLLVTIYKEYIELVTKNNGITPEHFLSLILWESEKNYDQWPEHRLGFRLMNIIENFSNMLSQRTLRDYFIRKKNIFRNVSRKPMEYANEIFHRIKQSPLTYIIRALRNLRCTSGSFYPPLDYKELLNILYKNDWTENPYLSNLSLSYASSDNISNSSTSLDKKPKFADAEKQLEYLKEKERRRKLWEKREKMNNIKNEMNLRYNVGAETRRKSSDSVKDEWECERRFDRPKKITLLKFFIKNYLDIAETSFQIGSKTQTMFFLKQASYLTKILEEENQLFAEEVTEFYRKIKQQEDKVIGAMKTNLTTYGSIEVLKQHNDHKDKELEEDLAALDDVSDKIDNSDDSTGENKNKANEDIHQQVRRAKINLRSLSRSFSANYLIPESSENFR